MSDSPNHLPLRKYRKGFKILVSVALVGFIFVITKAGSMLWASRSEGVPLRIKWEGAWLNLNARDVGQSINQCLGRNFLKEEVLIRANGWFSGWSCDRVGNPDVIYSLNHDAARNERYYCSQENTLVVGRDFGGTNPLKDLEFIENWDHSELRQTACAFFRDSFESIARGQKVLVHCDAGRDRTGTYAALATALVAESTGQLDSHMIDAIECDYRKTSSLSPEKFGRMARFIESVRQKGGVQWFFTERCGIAPHELDRVVKALHNS